jgi:hypothetical protein
VSPALIHRFQIGAAVSRTSSPAPPGEEAMNGSSLWMAGFVWGGLAFAQNGISVRICNSVHVQDKMLDQAKTEASFVLHTGGLTVTWLDCSTETMEQELGPRDFVLCLVAFRLSGADRPSQHVMGSTSVANRTQQNYVFVYYDSIAKTASDHAAEWQTYQILGYSIAHEMGHLLLGGEHTRRGVMRAVWGSPDLLLMSKREIKFSQQECKRIQQALEARIRAWPKRIGSPGTTARP